MKKFITTLILCCMLISTFSFTAFAQDDYGVMPCYDNVSRATVDISFSGTTGTAKGTAIKYSGVGNLEGTITVYKKVNGQWTYVCSNSNSTTGRSLTVSSSFTATANVEYKAVFTVVAYGTTTETISIDTTAINN